MYIIAFYPKNMLRFIDSISYNKISFTCCVLKLSDNNWQLSWLETMSIFASLFILTEVKRASRGEARKTGISYLLTLSDKLTNINYPI